MAGGTPTFVAIVIFGALRILGADAVSGATPGGPNVPGFTASDRSADNMWHAATRADRLISRLLVCRGG